MEVLPISEIYPKRRGQRELPVLNESFDVLIRAGDIWEGQPEKAVQSVVALAGGRPAIIVPGNHDAYRFGPEDRRTISDFYRLPHDKA